jgi:hypothetical protein
MNEVNDMTNVKEDLIQNLLIDEPNKVSLKTIDTLVGVVDLINPLGKSEDGKNRRMTQEFMGSIDPHDAVETMLATQMLATNNLITVLMLRAGKEAVNSLTGNCPINHVLAKMLKVFNQQVEVLEKYRRKERVGNISVGSVNVESGAQAIVGHVETNGR